MITSRAIEVTGDGAAATKAGTLTAVVLTAGDAAAATLVLYDNASAAAGNKLVTLKAAQGTSAVIDYTHAPTFANGVYADIGGAGAVAYVYAI